MSDRDEQITDEDIRKLLSEERGYKAVFPWGGESSAEMAGVRSAAESFLLAMEVAGEKPLALAQLSRADERHRFFVVSYSSGRPVIEGVSSEVYFWDDHNKIRTVDEDTLVTVSMKFSNEISLAIAVSGVATSAQAFRDLQTVVECTDYVIAELLRVASDEEEGS